jgi:imidazolonepropionase
MKQTLIKNISRLVTMNPASGRKGPLGVIERAALRIDDGLIAWVGSETECPKFDGEVLDAHTNIVMPGLVDCHTHLVHAGSRQGEFKLRSEGKSYQGIAAAGGGIMSTVRATRDASREKLLAEAGARIENMLSRGVTTVEIKTGYGLTLEDEMKMAEVIGELAKKYPADIRGTFLGAHVVPAEYRGNREEYIRIVMEEMLPAISGLVSACDVFVEEGAYTRDEAIAICTKAKEFGLAIHLHVDQFSDGGGGKLAAEVGALSASHLDYSDGVGMRAMADAGVVAVLLPGASFFTGGGRYPDARKMIGCGVTTAISTDYNPGTTPSLDPLMNASIAVTQMGMTCDEALLGITKNAALALGLSDRGTIEVGQRADLAMFDAPDEYYLLYRYGENCLAGVMIGGDHRGGGVL